MTPPSTGSGVVLPAAWTHAIRIMLCMECGALGRDCTAPPADRATSRRIADSARLEKFENRRMHGCSGASRFGSRVFCIRSRKTRLLLHLHMLYTGRAGGQLQKSLIDEEWRRQRCDFVEHPAQGNIRQARLVFGIAAADWARSGARKTRSGRRRPDPV